jgi:hypothetical protein
VTKESSDYASAPVYFDACRAWYGGLSWKERGIVAWVISVFTDRAEVAAEQIADSLPPAPRCPL